MAHPSEPPPSYDDIFSDIANPLRREVGSAPESPPEYSETPQVGQSRYFAPLPTISASIPVGRQREPREERPWYERNSSLRGPSVNVRKLQKVRQMIEISNQIILKRNNAHRLLSLMFPLGE